MKNINFITPLSPQQQYEIRRWFIITFFIVIMIIIGFVGYFVPQLYALYSTKKEILFLKEKTKNYTLLTQHRNSLKKSYESLNQKKVKIDNYLQAPHNPHFYLTTITGLCNNGIKLVQIHNNKKEIEISITCPRIEHATSFMDQIAKLDNFTQTKLLSIQQDHNKLFKCTIKSAINA